MSDDDAGRLCMPLILLVEDEILVREMVVEALNEAGFATLLAFGANEGATLFAHNIDKVRGLVTDINLGDGMNGWELACAVRRQSSALPVIYTSGASGHEWPLRGVPDSLMVTKPFVPAQVVVALSSLLAKAASTSP